ncbi:helix-turn-helix transcriptional regulator [Paracnuella aquatica]|uniref:helix-turn-helix transcriptional regulator n=1 Tax=Paracnuella aquatica TaxID=2268757 RepID=UPI000DEED348|nr:YafY family protein [Paracnuella aquatica]RPD46686.1 YafY family transcriptional regulator [Paracnuella aquatica]
MNRIDRLFGILTLLQSKKFVPAETIAAKFGISIRTVYRDVKALCEQGIPVSFEQGKGYFVVQGYFLPPVAFSSEEANALLLMETMVQGFADKSIGKHYATALQKVKAVLRSTQKDSVEALSPNIRIQLCGWQQPDYEYLSTLQQCIAGKTVVALRYTDVRQQPTERCIEPIGLLFYAFSWHLIAWCQLRQDYRDFKVERITAACNTGRAFTHTGHLTLDEYIKSLPAEYLQPCKSEEATAKRQPVKSAVTEPVLL